MGQVYQGIRRHRAVNVGLNSSEYSKEGGTDQRNQSNLESGCNLAGQIDKAG
jgi:hypothetical protein